MSWWLFFILWPLFWIIWNSYNLREDHRSMTKSDLKWVIGTLSALLGPVLLATWYLSARMTKIDAKLKVAALYLPKIARESLEAIDSVSLFSDPNKIVQQVLETGEQNSSSMQATNESGSKGQGNLPFKP